MYRRIMLAFDGSESSYLAAEHAFDLVEKYGAELEVVAVSQLPDFGISKEEAEQYQVRAASFFKQNFAQLERKAKARQVKFNKQLLQGHVGYKLVAHAQEGDFDLVVVGEKGHSRLEEIFLGGISRYVIKRAPCTVLVVKGKKV